MLPDKLCFVDVETTGMRPSWDRVIEVGVIRVEKGKVVDTFQSLLNPGDYLPAEITNLTGITSELLEKAPTFWEIKPDLLKILEGAVFVAHNVRFDYSFLKHEFKRLDTSFSPKHFCTAKLSRYLYPKFRHHSVDSLIERFGITVNNRHRAMGDAQVIWDFYQLIQSEFESAKLEKAVSLGLKQPTIPMRLDNKEIDNLPEGAGVYIFYGEKGAPLYVGKSKNIKERVKQHFSSDLINSKEMRIAQQVARLETIKTSGELGALILESSLIKKMQPMYNRMLRYSQRLMVLKEKVGYKNDNGYLDYHTVEASTVEQLDSADLDKILGVFKTKKQMVEYLRKLVDEYQLCARVLGIEKTLTNCFGYRLGKCLGACSGEEIPIKYNMRFAEAFASTKIKPWPFPGSVIITEEDQIEGTREAFVVDKWCFLGKVSRNEGGDTFEEVKSSKSLTVSEVELLKVVNEDLRFDVDNYRILSNFIFDPKNQKKIHLSPEKLVYS